MHRAKHGPPARPPLISRRPGSPTLSPHARARRAKHGQATNQGTATTGAVLSAIALALSVYGIYVIFAAVDDAVDELDKELNSMRAPLAAVQTPSR